MAAHLSFLGASADKISAAGPLSKSSGEAAGGLWFVGAETEGDVERLVQDDPFWPRGLRKSFTTLKCNQVYADGARLVHPEWLLCPHPCLCELLRLCPFVVRRSRAASMASLYPHSNVQLRVKMRDFWEMAKIVFWYLALPMGSTAILLTVLYNLLAPMN